MKRFSRAIVFLAAIVLTVSLVLSGCASDKDTLGTKNLTKEYFENNVLEPFTTYLQNKYPNIGMTKLMERIYQEATDKMKSIVFG